ELPGGAEVAAEPDLREGGAEAGTVGGEAQVTRERDAEAGARRRTVDRRDRHLRDRREEPGELVHLVLAIDVIFERPPCGARRAHRGDVASGTEGAPCPGHEHGADLGVGCTAPERGDGGVDHRVGEGVEAVGPVERQVATRSSSSKTRSCVSAASIGDLPTWCRAWAGLRRYSGTPPP